MQNTPSTPANTTCNCQQPAPKYPEQVTGMYVLARALKNIGIKNVYGLVGIPITEAAYMVQGQDIRFVGFAMSSRPAWPPPPRDTLRRPPASL